MACRVSQSLTPLRIIRHRVPRRGHGLLCQSDLRCGREPTLSPAPLGIDQAQTLWDPYGHLFVVVREEHGSARRHLHLDIKVWALWLVLRRRRRTANVWRCAAALTGV